MTKNPSQVIISKPSHHLVGDTNLSVRISGRIYFIIADLVDENSRKFLPGRFFQFSGYALQTRLLCFVNWEWKNLFFLALTATAQTAAAVETKVTAFIVAIRTFAVVGAVNWLDTLTTATAAIAATFALLASFFDAHLAVASTGRLHLFLLRTEPVLVSSIEVFERGNVAVSVVITPQVLPDNISVVQVRGIETNLQTAVPAVFLVTEAVAAVFAEVLLAEPPFTLVAQTQTLVVRMIRTSHARLAIPVTLADTNVPDNPRSELPE